MNELFVRIKFNGGNIVAVKSSGRALVKELVSLNPDRWFIAEEIKEHVREGAKQGKCRKHTEPSLNTLIRVCTTNIKRKWPRSKWGDKTHAEMDYNILFKQESGDAYRRYNREADPRPLVP